MAASVPVRLLDAGFAGQNPGFEIGPHAFAWTGSLDGTASFIRERLASIQARLVIFSRRVVDLSPVSETGLEYLGPTIGEAARRAFGILVAGLSMRLSILCRSFHAFGPDAAA